MLGQLFNKIKKKYSMDMNRKQEFTDIYERNLWGGVKGEYYSGSGSYRDDLVGPYIEWLKEFITKEKIESIVDLGCGDYNIGKRLSILGPQYIGVDIVEGLTQYNEKYYGNSNVKFMCLDIVSDDLPDGELCLIRQVFQHLHNSEIKQVLNKLNKYKYSVITEMVYDKAKASTYNIDIKDSRSTRRNQKSGVYLEENPFSKEIEIIKVLPYGENVNLVISLLRGSDI